MNNRAVENLYKKDLHGAVILFRQGGLEEH
jgi:hypothetical protein